MQNWCKKFCLVSCDIKTQNGYVKCDVGDKLRIYQTLLGPLSNWEWCMWHLLVCISVQVYESIIKCGILLTHMCFCQKSEKVLHLENDAKKDRIACTWVRVMSLRYMILRFHLNIILLHITIYADQVFPPWHMGCASRIRCKLLWSMKMCK
jgi:hypothetical protein